MCRKRIGVRVGAALLLLVVSACGREISTPAQPPLNPPSVAGQRPAALAEGAGSPQAGAAAASEWVLLLEPDVDATQIAADHDMTVVSVLGEAGLALLRGAGDLEDLESDGRVRSVQPNEELVLSEPVDLVMGFYEGDWTERDYSQQSGLGSLGLERIHPVSDGSDVTIVVLDTGADFSHPHLVDHLLRSPIPFLDQDEGEPNGVDDDGDGQIDEAHGHGTHVAGILATVAPGAELVPMRVLDDDGVGTAYQLAVGLHQSLWLGADVVNLSLSLSGQSDVVAETLERLRRAGVTIVAAAGNSGGEPRYPATDPSAVGIAALRTGTTLAEFSGRGDVPLAAPGVGIVSSYPGGEVARATGTSMACGVATGVFALVRSGTSRKSDPDPLLELFRTADPVTPLATVVHGAVSPLDALGLGEVGPALRGAPRARVTDGP